MALGASTRGTIFDSPYKLTSLACGVSPSTVTTVGRANIADLRSRLTYRRRTHMSRKAMRTAVFQRHEATWGEKVRQEIHRKFKEESDVTVAELQEALKSKYADFSMSITTLYRFLKAIGFSYRMNRGQRTIYEKEDIVSKREVYLRKIAEARNRGDCLIFIDETWVFDKMVKKRGWNDNNIPRFAPASMLEKYSCGRTAGKNKGRRAIVIAALGEDGVVPNCTKIIVSKNRSMDDDSDGDMDHLLFEAWLRDSIPHMVSWANGRQVTVVMDNAAYHSRQLEKVPSRSSTKAQITEFLRSKGIEVAEESPKADLIAELDHYVESRGGLARVRKYAVEEICDGLGVNLIRLPPFHPFFNPIELCWSQLKAHLTKYGKPSDKIETVKARAHHWLAEAPSSMASAWFRHIFREENDARAKQLIDAAAEDEAMETSSSLSLADVEYGSDISMESL
ncbi:hypothetical protein ANCCAN_03621 [Ancylostoma caninum]|uniref:Tc1-like transposase DDE domain-containing protein n=1 Tax=Ancylostoma caninum TaxID=29170 RepID=A0A368H191_ANCCA|nr:hypothetical protein ANCCAN_03621 [Ancylostoma caninum]